MKKRETELDILRLMALIGVIFTHASGINTDSALIKNIMTFLVATVTWHVPVFVMISGRFFLDPERIISASKLRKSIAKLVIALLFWNLIYQVYYVLTDAYAGLNWKGVLSQALIGPYHFWYLFMLIGMYAVTPFLRQFTKNKQLMEYFIALFLILEFMSLYGPNLPLIGATVSEIMTKANFHLALGYSGYYILGYYLHRHPLTVKNETRLYILGIAMFLFTGLATVWNSSHGVEGKEWFSKYLMPNVVIEAATLYTFFINRVKRISIHEKITSAISMLATHSFGVYLVHALVLNFIESTLGSVLPAHTVVAVVLRVILTFTISTLLTILLRKIPFIGKKIT